MAQKHFQKLNHMVPKLQNLKQYLPQSHCMTDMQFLCVSYIEWMCLQILLLRNPTQQKLYKPSLLSVTILHYTVLMKAARVQTSKWLLNG